MRALAEIPASGSAAAPSRPAGRWGDLRLRTLSAVVLGPAVLACIWFGGLAWIVLMAVAAVGLAFEWFTLCGARRPGWLALGVPYLGVPLAALAWLRGQEDGRADILFLILVVWASDIGAYVAGRLLGGPKLAPAISPGKTWSGAAGGLVSAMLTGAVVAHLLSPGAPGRAAAVAGLLGIASQAGDLFESWIKRRFGVKDSGHLIPGHGGLLDRLDGVLGAAPAAACVMLAVGRGGALWN